MIVIGNNLRHFSAPMDQLLPVKLRMCFNSSFCSFVRFSSALHKDKPNQATNTVMRKTEQASSSSSLVVNLHTPHQDALAEKLKVHKEKFQRFVFILLTLTVLQSFVAIVSSY